MLAALALIVPDVSNARTPALTRDILFVGDRFFSRLLAHGLLLITEADRDLSAH
jgi:hypothetical protein